MTKTSQSLSIMEKSVGEAVKFGVAHLSTEDQQLDGRQIQLGGKKCINFGSCSYLGIELDPRMKNAAIQAVEQFGTQFSSSRAYVSLGLYEELEAHLEQMFRAPVIVSASTTLGHLSAIPVIVGDNDAIILDHQVHASVSMACQTLRAKGTHIEMVRHNNIQMLEARINKLKDQYDKIWYMADGVYSMYGDFAPMDELAFLLEKYEQLHLYIDDAHGIGWKGERGTGHVYSVFPRHERLYLIGSMAKSFGASGGIIVFPNQEMKRKVRICGGTMIFSGPLQPATIAAAIASAKIHLSEELPQLQQQLEQRINYFSHAVEERGLSLISESVSPIRFIHVGEPSVTYNLAARLKSMGLYVNIAVYPSVPFKQCGLRITLTNHLQYHDIDFLLDSIADQLPMARQEERQKSLLQKQQFEKAKIG
ncbi:MAG: aminotransferase class I/II-fold pyridoxal phosphate-dependent enzyme [Bacteroidota bacterium]